MINSIIGIILTIGFGTILWIVEKRVEHANSRIYETQLDMYNLKDKVEKLEKNQNKTKLNVLKNETTKTDTEKKETNS